jgi:hypothetical protein
MTNLEVTIKNAEKHITDEFETYLFKFIQRFYNLYAPKYCPKDITKIVALSQNNTIELTTNVTLNKKEFLIFDKRLLILDPRIFAIQEEKEYGINKIITLSPYLPNLTTDVMCTVKLPK